MPDSHSSSSSTTTTFSVSFVLSTKALSCANLPYQSSAIRRFRDSSKVGDFVAKAATQVPQEIHQRKTTRDNQIYNPQRLKNHSYANMSIKNAYTKRQYVKIASLRNVVWYTASHRNVHFYSGTHWSVLHELYSISRSWGMRNANRGWLWFGLCPWRIRPWSQTQEKNQEFVCRPELPQEKKSRQRTDKQRTHVKEKSDLKTPFEIKYTDCRLNFVNRISSHRWNKRTESPFEIFWYELARYGSRQF